MKDAETLRKAVRVMREEWGERRGGAAWSQIQEFHLAVADWLDDTARLLDAAPDHPAGNGLLYDGNALTVARAYLGQTA